MIADFTNIDASMPASEVPNFFENTIAAHELEEWKLDEQTEERLRSLINGERTAYSADRKSVRHQFEQLWKQLYMLYTALHAEMEVECKGYAGMRQRAVITHWEDEEIQIVMMMMIMKRRMKILQYQGKIGLYSGKD